MDSTSLVPPTILGEAPLRFYTVDSSCDGNDEILRAIEKPKVPKSTFSILLPVLRARCAPVFAYYLQLFLPCLGVWHEQAALQLNYCISSENE